MDKPDNDLATKGVALLVGVALLAFAAQQVFGEDGVTAVLVLSLGVLAIMGFHRLSGRSFAGLSLPQRAEQDEPEAPAQDDTWRSERWVREAVARGLRSMDEWRMDQQAT